MKRVEPIIPDWPAPANVRALSTTRSGGLSEGEFSSLNLAGHVGDVSERVGENRKRLRVFADLPTEPFWLQQEHGIQVADLEAEKVSVVADAGFSRQPGQVCAVLTADCLPVLLCKADGTAVAAVHAGWRGLADGVIEATIAMMSGEGQQILAWLGPAIGPAVYQVGDDVRQAFVTRDPASACCFADDGPGHWRADLYALARRALNAHGVDVYGGGLCTFSDSRQFFSYRRDGRCGRQATIIWLEHL